MINISDYINESIFDVDKNIDKIDEDIKNKITNFINKYYHTHGRITISDQPNKDGKYEVCCNNYVSTRNASITSLTNNLFVWDTVDGCFDCSSCHDLKSLEGSPRKVHDTFNCQNCSSIKSLEGSPEEVNGSFLCCFCDSLTTLKGVPKEIGGSFSCSGCTSLKSLKYAPKNVNNCFWCDDCGEQFTEDDVKKVSNVKKTIYTTDEDA